MLALYISPILFILLNGSTAEERIQIERGQVYTGLISPGYPEVYTTGNTSLSWRFAADVTQKLKIFCDDLRITQSESCSNIRLEIDDGVNKEEYCGNNRRFNVISTTNWFTVKLEAIKPGQAAFSCYVKSLEAPEGEIVELNINKPYHLRQPNETTPFFDKLWHFKTEKGQQVEFKCFINTFETNSCSEEVVTIDVGDGPQKYCGFMEKLLFSKENEATLRIELGSNGNGKINCIMQAVVIHLPQTDEVRRKKRNTEDDSSEHGGSPGVKKTTCNCGWANKPKARIINGKEASPNEYPWIVAIKAYFGEPYIQCGGSIITQQHVLTAAHCLVNEYVDMAPVKPEDVQVTVGIHDVEKLTPKKSTKVFRAMKLFIREEFLKQYTHDIAIIVLNEKIEYTQTVGPICLSPKRIAEPNQKITILGWGKIGSKGITSTVLLKAKTAVIDSKKCDINPHEICTRADQSATCTGDSGGPLSWLDPETNRYTLMSLVSYGDPDCVSSPSVSTDIAYFYNWIQDIIKSTIPDEHTCNKI